MHSWARFLFNQVIWMNSRIHSYWGSVLGALHPETRLTVYRVPSSIALSTELLLGKCRALQKQGLSSGYEGSRVLMIFAHESLIWNWFWNWSRWVRTLKNLIRWCCMCIKCSEDLRDLKIEKFAGLSDVIWCQKMNKKSEKFERSRYLSNEYISEQDLCSINCF